jgi:hypothetical protein
VVLTGSRGLPQRGVDPVKHLINGTSIVQVKVDTVTFCHIEIPRHDIVLA